RMSLVVQRPHRGLFGDGSFAVHAGAARQPLQERRESLADGRRRRVVERAAGPGGIEVERSGGSIVRLELDGAELPDIASDFHGMAAADGRYVGFDAVALVRIPPPVIDG